MESEWVFLLANAAILVMNVLVMRMTTKNVQHMTEVTLPQMNEYSARIMRNNAMMKAYMHHVQEEADE